MNLTSFSSLTFLVLLLLAVVASSQQLNYNDDDEDATTQNFAATLRNLKRSYKPEEEAYIRFGKRGAGKEEEENNNNGMTSMVRKKTFSVH